MKIEKKMDALLERGKKERVFTKAAASVCTVDEIWVSGGKEKALFFDLASLTKVVATFSMLLKFLGNKLSAEDHIGDYLPVVSPLRDVKIIELLTHTSGLPSWRPFYRFTSPENPSPEEVKKKVMATVPIRRRGERLYSDIGFMLLGFLIEKLGGGSLSLTLNSIFPREGERAIFYLPRPADEKDKFVPTGYCAWRKRRLRGEVHDENAYALGGEAGHAGCFSTIYGVSLFCQEILRGFRGKSSLFPLSKLDSLIMEREGRKILAGWDYPEGERSTAGRYFSEFTIGHLGFTGTSLWIDIKRETGIVLLTNRTIYGKNNPKINPFRRLFYNEIMRDII